MCLDTFLRWTFVRLPSVIQDILCYSRANGFQKGDTKNFTYACMLATKTKTYSISGHFNQNRLKFQLFSLNGSLKLKSYRP